MYVCLYVVTASNDDLVTLSASDYISTIMLDTAKYKFMNTVDYFVNIENFVAIKRSPRSMDIFNEDDGKVLRRLCVMGNFLAFDSPSKLTEMVAKTRPFKYVEGLEYGDLQSMRMPDGSAYWTGPLWTHDDRHFIEQITVHWQHYNIEVILRFGIKPDKK